MARLPFGPFSNIVASLGQLARVTESMITSALSEAGVSAPVERIRESIDRYREERRNRRAILLTDPNEHIARKDYTLTVQDLGANFRMKYQVTFLDTNTGNLYTEYRYQLRDTAKTKGFMANEFISDWNTDVTGTSPPLYEQGIRVFGVELIGIEKVRGARYWDVPDDWPD